MVSSSSDQTHHIHVRNDSLFNISITHRHNQNDRNALNNHELFVELHDRILFQIIYLT